MQIYTPIKNIDKGISASKVNKSNKEQSSEHLKIEYLQNRLKARQAKFQQSQNKIKQLTEIVSKQQSIISSKQQQIIVQNQKIKLLNETLKKLENELKSQKQAKHKLSLTFVNQKQKIDSANLATQKQLSRALSKQNYELIMQKNELKKIIQEYDATIQQTRAALKLEQQNSVLIQKLNEDLKLKIQQLLFELRQAHKKVDTSKLYDYQTSIQLRANKQNEDINDGGTEQLVSLLKQRIVNLEQQIEKSQSRNRHLQAILISK